MDKSAPLSPKTNPESTLDTTPSTSTVFLGPAFTCAFVDTSRLEKSSTYPQRSPMAGAASDGVD